MSAPGRSRHVVVLGLMGAGKTTVGLELARRLGWRFSDSDHEIEAQTGRTARVLKEELGVRHLHELEAKHLLSSIGVQEPTVISAAASVVDSERCRRALRSGDVFTVWLSVSADVLAERFGRDPHRPHYGSSLLEFLPEQVSLRQSSFREVASLAVHAARCTPSEIVDEILARSCLTPIC